MAIQIPTPEQIAAKTKTSAPPPILPSGMYYGPQAKNPLANPTNHGTPPAPTGAALGVPRPEGTTYPGEVRVDTAGLDQGSLKDTMTTPQSSTPPVSSTPKVSTSSIPGGQTTIPTSTPGAPQTPPEPSSSQFAQYLSTMQEKLKANNVLADARAKLITALYDRPLTPDEITTLPPAVAKAISTGNKNDIELQIRLLNDQIQGRTGSLDQSVNFLSQEYDKTLADTEKQKQDAINNVLDFVKTYGSNAKQALTSLYGPQYLDQLKKYGIDINNLSSVKTLDQQKQDSTTGNIGSIVYSQNDPPRIVNNNNLIAAAMATGSKGNEFTQALDKAGIAWEQGNAFSDNPSMSTIKILGDPMEAARAILSDSKAIQNWYINHTGKSILPQYGVKNNTDFANLSLADQNAVIKGIYQGEGGKGDLKPVESDVQAIADGIQNGTQPPLTTGLYKNSGPVRAELARRGFDLAKATQQWNAAVTFIKSLNSFTAIKFNGLATSVVNSIDEVKKLASQLNLTGIPVMNSLELQKYIQLNSGSTDPNKKNNADIAAQYVAAVNTAKEEFANLATGGYAPTDSAWKLANDQINGNYDVNKLNSSLDEVQRLINFRTTAINTQTPNTGGIGNSGQTVTMDDGTTWLINPDGSYTQQ